MWSVGAFYKVFNCRVLGQIGKFFRIEDQPRFCENYPIRLNAIRFLNMPPESRVLKEKKLSTYTLQVGNGWEARRL